MNPFDIGNIMMYALLLIIFISSMVIKKDTKQLIHRSDAIQKSLNAYIRKEQK